MTQRSAGALSFRMTGRSSSGVPKASLRALDEQHGRPDGGQMLGARHLGAARRMQRIAEEEEPRHRIGLDPRPGRGRDLRGDAAPHRLAADDQLAAAQALVECAVMKGLDHLPIAGLQLVAPVGKAPAFSL